MHVLLLLIGQKVHIREHDGEEEDDYCMYV